jgi:hypothetical protein
VGEIGNAYKVSFECVDGRAFGRPRCGWLGWMCEIAVDLKNVNCVPLAWDNGIVVVL